MDGMGKERDMKLIRLHAIPLVGAALVSIGLTLPAQDTRPAPDTRADPAPPDLMARSGSVGTRLSDLVGRVIQNQRAESLGRIQDLVLDEVDGRIAYAIVDFDNDRAGGKLWVVPWDLLRSPPATDANASPTSRTILLDLPRDRLAGAPAFPSTAWPEIDRGYGRRVYEFYGRAPYWDGRPATNGDGALAVDDQRRRPNNVDPTRSRRDVRPLEKDDLRELESFPVGMFEARNIRTVNGTVTSIIEQDGAENDFGMGIRLLVRREDATSRSQDLLVFVGPTDFVKKQQGFSFKQNDRVTLKGAEMDRDDRRVFVATEIALGDRILLLRRDNGLPVWRRKAGPKVGED
jgi:sporulation protein YlmC with PRC-barrel domain